MSINVEVVLMRGDTEVHLTITLADFEFLVMARDHIRQAASKPSEQHLVESLIQYFNSVHENYTCRECGNDLSPGNDGFGTEHGTCNSCIDKGDDSDD